MDLEDFARRGQAAQQAADVVTPPLPKWECDPETCNGCGQCYQRTGEGVCAANCYHGILEDAELLAGLLQTGQVPEGDELPRMAHVVRRLVQVVNAADELRDALNRVDTWEKAVSCTQPLSAHRTNAHQQRALATEAATTARRELARVMDGR